MWRDALDDFFWADRYGWTPDQTGEVAAVRLRRLRQVTHAVDEGRAKRAKEDADDARGR